MLSTRLNQETAAGTRFALIGAAIWITWVIATQPARTPLLLMLSPFVIVQLVLAVLTHVQKIVDPAIRRFQTVALPTAFLAALSFSFEPGRGAALLTIPWLIFAVSLAAFALLRALGRHTLLTPSIGFDIGFVQIVVGATWLTISRAGANPLGFGDAIVQLTAVHFHYAGFALPVVAGLLAHHRSHRRPVLPIVATWGVALTAIGITAGGIVEWLGATFMAIVGLVIAALLVRTGVDRSGRAGVLLAIAGVSLSGGMIMSLVWSWTVWFGVTGPGLDLMVATHGSLNAIGFGLVGMIGFALLPGVFEDERQLHLGRPSADRLAAMHDRHASSDITCADDLLDGPTPTGWERQQFVRDIANGQRAQAIERLQAWTGHDAAGICRSHTAPIATGETIALAIPVGPLSVTATSRIVNVIDEPNRYGFTYATLPHHPMQGAESFVIEGDGADLRIVVDVVARPALFGARVIPPVTNWLQGRAINRYLTGIAGSREPGI